MNTEKPHIVLMKLSTYPKEKKSFFSFLTLLPSKIFGWFLSLSQVDVKPYLFNTKATILKDVIFLMRKIKKANDQRIIKKWLK